MMRILAFVFAFALLLGLGWIGQQSVLRTDQATHPTIVSIHAPPGVIAASNDVVAPLHEQAPTPAKNYLMVLTSRPGFGTELRSHSTVILAKDARISNHTPFMINGGQWATPLNNRDDKMLVALNTTIVNPSAKTSTSKACPERTAFRQGI